MNLLRATGVLAVGLLGLFLVHPAPEAGQATTSCEDVDLSSPFETLLLCAQQGNASAQYHLGRMYANGFRVTEDDAEAVRWCRLAVDQGYARAQFNLGAMYDNGEGVPEDLVLAYMWYNLSAAQGHETAQARKERLVPDMTREQIAEAQRMSREWLEAHR
jgi:TPR repeat protein